MVHATGACISRSECQIPTHLCFLVSLEHATNAEQAHLRQSLQRCLELRDKYMLKSAQRIGDDPRDYDGHFQTLNDDHADVCGTRPHVAIDAVKSQSQANLFERWNIYPKPPPPHWHWKDSETVVSLDGAKTRPGHNGFNFDDCTIPGEHLGWSFSIDSKGVIQVYDDNKGTSQSYHKLLYLTFVYAEEKNRKPAFDIPDIREYFLDLELVLSVISDGPTKSFAFRRLKYLSSKFTMYSLLNEFQELADMKVQ